VARRGDRAGKKPQPVEKAIFRGNEGGGGYGFSGFF